MDTSSVPEFNSSCIVAVIPAYQEGPYVATVVSQVRSYGLPVVVVDDGSTDDTGVRARAAGATVLRQEQNRGKGAALKTGFRRVLNLEQEVGAVLTLDADGQHDPADVPRFLEAYSRDGHDLIIGARNFDEMPWTRYTMNMLGRWTLSQVLGQPMPDNQSGYRLISRRLVQAALGSKEDGYEFEVDMIVICMQRAYTLGWVPIRTIYNGRPSHINHVAHVYKYLRLLWRIRQQMRSAGLATKELERLKGR